METKNLAHKALALARVTGELLRRAQKTREKTAAEKAAIKKLVPTVVTALVTNERIFDNQKNEVAEKIASNHLTCLELIRDLAAHRNPTEVAAIGKAKTASARPATRGPIGARVTNFDDTESGQIFADILMRGRTAI